MKNFVFQLVIFSFLLLGLYQCKSGETYKKGSKEHIRNVTIKIDDNAFSLKIEESKTVCYTGEEISSRKIAINTAIKNVVYI